ncbi:hypothetical protein [Burkholderia pseudomallei]|uniref:hypothetical protein n=1 Tax=Burkholderia pseudomallei TaxID=28450 RepID=UPI0011C4C0CA|nr:hypothetical protein [Burkholderia pseudomallei]
MQIAFLLRTQRSAPAEAEAQTQVLSKIKMKGFDLAMVFKERRFLGVRLWLCTFPLAGIGFFLFLMGQKALGLLLFSVSWISAVIGFFIHTSRWRGHE